MIKSISRYLEIYKINGQLIDVLLVEDGATINVEHFENGIYFIKLEDRVARYTVAK